MYLWLVQRPEFDLRTNCSFLSSHGLSWVVVSCPASDSEIHYCATDSLCWRGECTWLEGGRHLQSARVKISHLSLSLCVCLSVSACLSGFVCMWHQVSASIFNLFSPLKICAVISCVNVAASSVSAAWTSLYVICKVTWLQNDWGQIARTSSLNSLSYLTD